MADLATYQQGQFERRALPQGTLAYTIGIVPCGMCKEPWPFGSAHECSVVVAVQAKVSAKLAKEILSA